MARPMTRENKRRGRKVRNLIFVTSITAIILVVSTYAWFVGMRTVNVSDFDVEIASTESLLLSLDGSTWDNTVSISRETLDNVSYDGHTNSWGGTGLFPLSTVGAMDTAASRMTLYEKASLTTTPGGFRLMASRVKNYETGATEQDGYVAFDLFIKNFSGTQYITELEPLDEEAIYLTTDSAVTVASDGVANTGIENSVRVAFGQVGRVEGTTTTPATITGITCTDSATVTGICRTAQIWEPNDKAHVNNAISWYEEACKARIAADVTDPASYSGACGTVVNGTTYPTYAVSTDITSADRVDVYDGAEYNKYTGSVKLQSFPYFTDSMKMLTGTNRPTFMTLAPNSITKVRIYIYIEGQDVDNYDFASIGKKITVKFGFTKERFEETDINYDGPAIDKTAPAITLTGDNPMTVALNDPYTEPGATATDTVDGDLTAQIVTSGTVDTATAGTYVIYYRVSDAEGNRATKTRTVIVE